MVLSWSFYLSRLLHRPEKGRGEGSRKGYTTTGKSRRRREKGTDLFSWLDEWHQVEDKSAPFSLMGTMVEHGKWPRQLGCYKDLNRIGE